MPARMPATLQLMGLSLLVALVIALPTGVLSALLPDSIVDRFGVVLALVGQAIPDFFLGIVLILFFSATLNWLPSSGRGGVEHLILPALTLGTAAAAFIDRLLRSSLREVLATDYIRTARFGAGPSGDRRRTLALAAPSSGTCRPAPVMGTGAPRTTHTAAFD